MIYCPLCKKETIYRPKKKVYYCQNYGCMMHDQHIAITDEQIPEKKPDPKQIEYFKIRNQN